MQVVTWICTDSSRARRLGSVPASVAAPERPDGMGMDVHTVNTRVSVTIEELGDMLDVSGPFSLLLQSFSLALACSLVSCIYFRMLSFTLHALTSYASCSHPLMFLVHLLFSGLDGDPHRTYAAQARDPCGSAIYASSLHFRFSLLPFPTISKQQAGRQTDLPTTTTTLGDL